MKKIIVFVISIFVLGSAMVSAESCMKEGEITNASLGPQYYKPCCSGLLSFNRKIGMAGGGALCYSNTKGIPECKKVGTIKGWYYTDGKLLKKDDSCKIETGTNNCLKEGLVVNLEANERKDCCPGLSYLKDRGISTSGGPMCYKFIKGTPMCKNIGNIKGRYYPDGTLLKKDKNCDISDNFKLSTFSDEEVGFSFQYPDNDRITINSSSNPKRIQNYISSNNNALKSGDFYIEIFYRDTNVSCKDEMGSISSKYILSGINISKGYGIGGGDSGGIRYALCFSKGGKTIYIGYTENGKLYKDKVMNSLAFKQNTSNNCKKEGEIENQNVSNVKCCAGLGRFEYRRPGASSTPMCYNVSKGIPQCKKAGTSNEGRYYNDGILLKKDNECAKWTLGSSTSSSKGSGYIEGSLSYPSSGIPTNMEVCAEDVSTKKTLCTSKQIKNSKYTYGVGYSLKVPVGNYNVFARIIGKSTKAYYSTFVTCGLDASCKSHNPIAVVVTKDKYTTDINPRDRYK